MNLRERWELVEKQILSPYATLSSESKGRAFPNQECEIRTAFQKDRDRIIHCKSFRRIKHKTQVFIAPLDDHFRTRLTHTLEVTQIARTIARALRLNEDLVEAIALGHDLGHTPFGHAGEAALNSLLANGFQHREQSLRVVEKLERGQGLNLTLEVRDGILCHSGHKQPMTLEGQVVRFSDRIAYINHDIDDAIRAGIISKESLPKAYRLVLGDSHSARINTMVKAVIETSIEKNSVSMEKEVQAATDGLRNFMFDHVYIGSLAKTEEGKVAKVIKDIFEYYMEQPAKMPEEYLKESDDSIERRVADYICGMTDIYATEKYKELFVPVGFRII